MLFLSDIDFTPSSSRPEFSIRLNGYFRDAAEMAIYRRDEFLPFFGAESPYIVDAWSQSE